MWNIYLNFPFLSFLGNTNNCRDTFRSRYLSSKNDSRSQNSIIRFDRAFLRLCPTLNAAPISPPLSSNRSNLWPPFFRQKKYQTETSSVRSSTFVTVFKRYLGSPWSGETTLDVTGKDVCDFRRNSNCKTESQLHGLVTVCQAEGKTWRI